MQSRSTISINQKASCLFLTGDENQIKLHETKFLQLVSVIRIEQMKNEHNLCKLVMPVIIVFNYSLGVPSKNENFKNDIFFPDQSFAIGLK